MNICYKYLFNKKEKMKYFKDILKDKLNDTAIIIDKLKNYHNDNNNKYIIVDKSNNDDWTIINMCYNDDYSDHNNINEILSDLNTDITLYDTYKKACYICNKLMKINSKLNLNIIIVSDYIKYKLKIHNRIYELLNELIKY